MSSSRITYTPRPDATPEGELDALASVYAYISKCGLARRKGGVGCTAGDAKEIKNARANPILPRQ